MTDQLEERISRLLRERAGQAGSGDEVAGVAHRRGRRIILRRRIVAGVAGLAALAVAVPVGLNALGPETQKIEPIETSTPLPRRTLPAKETKVTLDIDKLQQGKTPAVPYYSDGAIHDGAKTIPVPGAKTDSYVNFVPAAGTYAVQIGDGPDGKSMLLDSNGAKIRDLPVLSAHVSLVLPAISADGRTLAWPEWDASGSGEMVVANASTGQELHRRRVDSDQFPYPAGFIGQQVLLTDDYGGYVRLWEPESGRLSSIAGVRHALTTDGRQRLVADEDGRYPVFDARTGRRLWDTAAGIRLLRGGQYAYFADEVSRPGTDEVTMQTTIVDAATGRHLLEVTGTKDGPVAAEPDGTILFGADSPTGAGAALVRCTIDGKCERATEKRSSDNGFPWTLPWPR
ncbi:WD40 repeat domain-containing protein [Flindersiella endophytica]